jgi:hypothetical protein
MGRVGNMTMDASTMATYQHDISDSKNIVSNLRSRIQDFGGTRKRPG